MRSGSSESLDSRTVEVELVCLCCEGKGTTFMLLLHHVPVSHFLQLNFVVRKIAETWAPFGKGLARGKLGNFTLESARPWRSSIGRFDTNCICQHPSLFTSALDWVSVYLSVAVL